jgi:hypothetical protein
MKKVHGWFEPLFDGDFSDVRCSCALPDESCYAIVPAANLDFKKIRRVLSPFSHIALTFSAVFPIVIP